MHLIVHAQANGMGYFALLILPAGTLWAVSAIIFCAFGADLSNKIAQIVLFGGAADVNIKDYMFKPVQFLGLFLCASGAHFLLNKLFAGLF